MLPKLPFCLKATSQNYLTKRKSTYSKSKKRSNYGIYRKILKLYFELLPVIIGILVKFLSKKMNILTSNLWKLFTSLADDEIKELDKAVRSPFFNYRDEEISLFDYLHKIRKGRLQVTSGEATSKYVFGDGKTDLAKLRHVMTYLTRIITRYLAIREMEQAEDIKQLLLVRSLRKRNNGKQFLAEYETAKHYLDSEMPLRPELYYGQLQLHTEFYNFSITNKRAPTGDLQVFTRHLDTFYIIQKLPV